MDVLKKHCVTLLELLALRFNSNRAVRSVGWKPISSLSACAHNYMYTNIFIRKNSVTLLELCRYPFYA